MQTTLLPPLAMSVIIESTEGLRVRSVRLRPLISIKKVQLRGRAAYLRYPASSYACWSLSTGLTFIQLTDRMNPCTEYLINVRVSFMTPRPSDRPKIGSSLNRRGAYTACARCVKV